MLFHSPTASAFLRAYADLQVGVSRWSSQDGNSNSKRKPKTWRWNQRSMTMTICCMERSAPLWSRFTTFGFLQKAAANQALHTSLKSSDSHISHHRYAVFRVGMLPKPPYWSWSVSQGILKYSSSQKEKETAAMSLKTVLEKEEQVPLPINVCILSIH